MTRPLTGRAILITLIAFFGVIIAVNTVFIIEAVGTFRGEDEPTAYLQGLEYNRTLAAREAQARLGWRASIDAARLPSGVVTIAVTMQERDDHPVGDLRLTGSLDHPSDAERDRPLAFRAAGKGVYFGTTQGVAPGNWNVVIRARAPDGTPFEARREVFLQ